MGIDFDQQGLRRGYRNDNHSLRSLCGRRIVRLLVSLGLVMSSVTAFALDHEYAALNELLAKHVKWDAKGVASAVDYAGFARDQPKLDTVTQEMSAVTRAQYNQFSRDRKLAFLINAYNAFTIQLILTKYPDLKSIKDLGSLFRSPWKKNFFKLLDDDRNLDWIEHTMIRAPGVFGEPRIHFVVNCASIGCPALRPEAMIASRLNAQLADSTRRFFSDRSRNRFDATSGELQVTKLLDWYGEDFRPEKKFLATYAKQLADSAADQARIRSGDFSISFLDYDWTLNRQ
ncbi:MAG: DUF547 domain-containing protein [Burkholderiaceae bacterium]